MTSHEVLQESSQRRKQVNLKNLFKSLSLLLPAMLLLFLTHGIAKAQTNFFTTKSDGTTVNQNLYGQRQEVYLNGGPQHIGGAGLPDGTYLFEVTEPGANGALLSTDLAIYR